MSKCVSSKSPYLFFHSFLVSFSDEIFNKPSFSFSEVPSILHTALEQIFVGKFFNFHLRRPLNKESCSIATFIQHFGSGTSILSILKILYLNESCTQGSTSLNKPVSFNLPPGQQNGSLASSNESFSSLLEVKSFNVSRSSGFTDLSVCSNDSDSDPSSADRSAHTPEDQWSTQITSDMILYLFNQSELWVEVDEDEDRQEAQQYWPESELPTDIEQQLEIVEELEAEWLPTQEVVTKEAIDEDLLLHMGDFHKKSVNEVSISSDGLISPITNPFPESAESSVLNTTAISSFDDIRNTTDLTSPSLFSAEASHNGYNQSSLDLFGSLTEHHPLSSPLYSHDPLQSSLQTSLGSTTKHSRSRFKNPTTPPTGRVRKRNIPTKLKYIYKPTNCNLFSATSTPITAVRTCKPTPIPASKVYTSTPVSSNKPSIQEDFSPDIL